MEIDLSDPHVSVRVSPGGPDPDGEGKFQTTLMPTSAIAQRERFDLAVNGDFFQAQKSNDGAHDLIRDDGAERSQPDQQYARRGEPSLALFSDRRESCLSRIPIIAGQALASPV